MLHQTTAGHKPYHKTTYMIYGSQWFPKFINNCPFFLYTANILIFIFSDTQEKIKDLDIFSAYKNSSDNHNEKSNYQIDDML